MEQELKEKEKLEATVSAQLKSANETVAAETKKQKQVEKSLKDDEKALESKMAELGTAKSVFDSLRQAEQQDAEALAAAQRKFQAVSSGLMSNDDGQDSSLQDQLMCKYSKILILNLSNLTNPNVLSFY
jgi:structural maintenance of chromosome 2